MEMSEILSTAGHALGRVLVVGLLLGAGLPALFALGVRSLGDGVVVGDPAGRSSRPGTVAAGTCFGVCVVAVVAGVVVLAYGKQLFGG